MRLYLSRTADKPGALVEPQPPAAAALTLLQKLCRQDELARAIRRALDRG